MTLDEMRAIALGFPGAEEGTSYGQPAFLVNKKFFTRLRKEDQSLVLLEVGFDEREMLMEAEPATFHFTAHYKDYPAVLARMESLHPGSFQAFLERRWRKVAPRKAVKDWDAAKAS
ncbi:MAG: MmcQ/YjbR family DNA-binding protein [Proteobacteria bacterium]|nr:MmcQ/YjbR family DNA-binding protein [Pseudomonadota bacterium]